MRTDNLFGRLIRYYRKEKGMSQEKLADGICSREYIGKLERGENIPTLETMSLLSGRLEVDLHRAYSEIYKNHDLDIYLQIRELDKAIETDNRDLIASLTGEYEKLKGFSSGQPLQYLCYAKTFLADGDESLRWIEKGLRESYPFFPGLDDRAVRPSNIEFALILSYAVILCRTGDEERALQYYDYVIHTAYRLLENSVYEIESNRSFWLNVICSSICNKYIFYGDSSEEMLSEIESILRYQKQNNRIHMLPQLLLCKTAILMKNNRESEAASVYKTAQTLGVFYYAEDGFERMKKRTLGKQIDVQELDRLL